MSKLPWDLAIVLRQGTVYKMQHRQLTSALPHFLVVLNPSPRSSVAIVLGIFSSKVEQTKSRRCNESNETLVEITPDEYKELTVNSIIDCNSIIQLDINELIEKHKAKQLTNCDDLSAEIIEKLIEGVLKSRLVHDKVKNILRKYP